MILLPRLVTISLKECQARCNIHIVTTILYETLALHDKANYHTVITNISLSLYQLASLLHLILLYIR